MAIPSHIAQLAQRLLTEFCSKRCPQHLHDQVKLSHHIRGNAVKLIELRPFYLDPKRWTESLVATFEYDPQTGTWELFARDRNERKLVYDLEPTKNLSVLLDEVDADPTGIFWG